MRRALVVAAAALAAFACSNAGEGRLLNVSADGIVKGFIYSDADGNRVFSQGDDSVKSMTVRLVTMNGTDTVGTGTTPLSGRFRIANVPVGTYRVLLDTTPLADTMRIAQQDSTTVTILPGDSVGVILGVSYPHVSIRAARTAVLVGRKVFVEGIVLNSPNPPSNFSDTTMHVQDTSAAIRATRIVATPATVADSVRMRGTTSTRTGQRTLDLVTVFPISPRFLPSATVATTLQAKLAFGGTRDAQLIDLPKVTVSDTTRGTMWRMTVNDSAQTGALEIVLDPQADFAFRPPFPPGTPASPYVPGSKFHIVGLLVPSGTAGIWWVKPRSAADIVLLP